MNDRNWRGGRKSSAGPPAQPSGGGPSRNWRSENKATTGRKQTSNKRLPRLIAAGLFLAILIVAAILLWNPEGRVASYFYTFNQVTGLKGQTYGTVLQLPDNAATANYWTIGRHFANTLTGEPKFPAEQTHRSGKSNVVIVYYRPIDSSDPALSPAAGFRTLKDELNNLSADVYKLLIVDINSADPDWRQGFFGQLAPDDLSQWPASIQNLAVIVSGDQGEQSFSSDLPDWGGTIFERFVEQGFSNAADTNSDQQLTLLEFYDFVATKTTDWVSNYRRGSGQHVQIFPDRKELVSAENTLDFVLMKSLPDPPRRDPQASQFATLQSEISSSWERLAALPRYGIAFPVRSRAVVSHLHAAEFTLQNGRETAAKEHLHLAQDTLSVLESDLKRPTEFQLATERLNLFQEDAAFTQWKSTAAFADYTSVLGNLQPAENMIRDNIQLFDFPGFGITAPTSDQSAEFVQARQDLERVAGMAIGCSNQVEPLLMQVQQQLLAAEDLVFVNPAQLPNSSPMNAQQLRSKATEMNRKIEEYVRLSLKSRGLARELLAILPNDLQWAAANWEPDAENRKRLLDGLSQRALISDPGRLSSTAQLQIAVANLVQHAETFLATWARHTGTSFSSFQDVEQATAELKLAYDNTQTSHEHVQNLFSALLDKDPAASTENQWTGARNALRAPFFDAAQRATLTALGHDPINEEKSQGASAKSSPSTAEMRISEWHERMIWETAWALRINDLLAVILADESSTKTHESLRNTWTIFSEDLSTEKLAQSLEKIGIGIRSHWDECRESIRIAANPNKEWDDPVRMCGQLNRADLAARLLFADDFDLVESHETVTRELTAAGHIQYSLMQADRALLSQWILLSDPRTRWFDPATVNLPVSDKWYVQVCDHWLKQAGTLIDKAKLGEFSKRIENRQASLSDADSWTFGQRAKGTEPLEFPFGDRTITTSLTLDVGSPPHPGLGSYSLTPGSNPSESAKLLNVSLQGMPVELDQPGQQVNVEITLDGQPATGNCSNVTYQGDFFYRGRTYRTAALTVDPCPAAEQELHFLANRNATQVTLNGEDNRPVMLVLDWSRSMLISGNKRNLAALDALQSILDEDANILSQQAKVGLVVFGHRRYWENQDGITVNQLYKNFAEQNGRDFQGLDKIDPLDDVVTEVAPRRLELNRDELQNVIKVFRDIEPWGTTPLGQAFIEAANRLDQLNEDGGLICVISDGAAFDLGRLDDLLTPADISKFENKYGKAYVENWRNKCVDRFEAIKRRLSSDNINAVILALDFKKGDPEFRNLEKVFDSDQSGLHVPIQEVSSVSEPRPDRLRDVLAQQVKPRPWSIKHVNEQQGTTYPLGQVGSVSPGQYSVQFGQKFSLNDFTISTGDQLQLSLNWNQERIEVVRNLDAKISAPAVPGSDQEPDMPTLLHAGASRIAGNQGQESAIQLMIMLDHYQVQRPVRRPAETEFELKAIVDIQFRAQQTIVEETPQFGAPGWIITADTWPRNQGVNLTAWWKMSRTPPDQVLRVTEFLEANSSKQTKTFGDNGIPRFQLWQQVTNEGTDKVFEVYLEAVDKLDFETLRHVRVEMGTARILNDPETFAADPVEHQVRIIESGVVVHSFIYPKESAVEFTEKVIGLTTAQSRRAGASTVTIPVTP